jgi:hypothetical protein
LRHQVQRLSLALFSAVFILTLLTQLFPSVTDAGQVTTRSITMSTSAPSAQATYTLTFTPATTSANGSLIVDFCSNDPLINDTCSFAATTVPTVSSGITSSVGTAGVLGSGSPIHTISVTTISGGFTAGTPITITFDATPSSHLTNPTITSANNPFYARVITWNSATGATSDYTPANTTGGTPSATSYTDYGGIALSSTNSITITATVFETLSFCVFQTSCGTAAALSLGAATTNALSTTQAYVNDNAQYTLATNAGSGVVVTMTGTTLCRSSTLSNCVTGASQYTISAIGVTPVVSATGTEQFGMCAYKNGSTAVTVATQYIDSVNACNPSGLATGSYSGSSKFGLDDSTTTTTGTASAGGSQVITSTGAVPSFTGTLAFLGNIAATTESGIYTTTLNMVATGTF